MDFIFVESTHNNVTFLRYVVNMVGGMKGITMKIAWISLIIWLFIDVNLVAAAE